MLKKIALASLIIFNQSCSTTKLIHVPVGCMGQPDISLGFTDEEAESISESAGDKLTLFAATLRARIDTQCNINKSHDEIHQ